MNWNTCFTKTILDRGRRYQKKGLVKNIKKVGEKYTAEVIGSMPYKVSVWRKANRQWGMTCTCPYADDGSRCKHMAALCLELEQQLDEKELEEWIFVPKPVEEQVYPFPVKNEAGAKEYTYYDLSVMTENINFKQKDIDAARRVMKKGAITLQDVKIGYRTSNYLGDSIQGGRITAICKEASEQGVVSIDFSAEEIIMADCRLPRCHHSYHSGYYGFGTKKLCKHEIATLFLLEEYIEEYNPGDNTNYEGLYMLKSYQHMNRNQVIDTVCETVEDVHLEPKLEQNGDKLKLSFRVGTNKLFVIKNLTEFIKYVEEKGKQTFGKSTEIDYSIHKIHEDSKAYYSYIRKIVKEEEKRFIAEDLSAYEELEIGNTISLYGSRLDDFFELISKSDISVSYIDKLGSKKGTMLKTREKSPKVQMEIRRKTGKNHIFTGISVLGTFPNMMNGQNDYYFIEEPYLNRVDREAAEVLAPLFEIGYDGQVSFEVGRKSLSDFYYHTMPILSAYVDIIEKQKEEIEEKIVHLQEAKKDLADEILSGENGGLSQMSKEDLLELL